MNLLSKYGTIELRWLAAAIRKPHGAPRRKAAAAPTRRSGRKEHDGESREQAEAASGEGCGRVLHFFELHGRFTPMKNHPLRVPVRFGCGNVRE